MHDLSSHDAYCDDLYLNHSLVASLNPGISLIVRSVKIMSNLLWMIFSVLKSWSKHPKHHCPTCQHHPWSSACQPVGHSHRWLKIAKSEQTLRCIRSTFYKCQIILNWEIQPITFQSVSPSSTMARIPNTFTSNTSPLNDKTLILSTHHPWNTKH